MKIIAMLPQICYSDSMMFIVIFHYFFFLVDYLQIGVQLEEVMMDCLGSAY